MFVKKFFETTNWKTVEAQWSNRIECVDDAHAWYANRSCSFGLLEINRAFNNSLTCSQLDTYTLYGRKYFYVQIVVDIEISIILNRKTWSIFIRNVIWLPGRETKKKMPDFIKLVLFFTIFCCAFQWEHVLICSQNTYENFLKRMPN